MFWPPHFLFIGHHIFRHHLLTDLDLLIGRPVNGLIAPWGPSPSFCASYLNLCLSFAFSLSMSLSFCKRLVVVKDREEILRGRAMAIKAISAKIHYEIQKHDLETFTQPVGDRENNCHKGSHESDRGAPTLPTHRFTGHNTPGNCDH